MLHFTNEFLFLRTCFKLLSRLCLGRYTVPVLTFIAPIHVYRKFKATVMISQGTRGER